MNTFQGLCGQKGVPPLWKKIFSADLHELGHEKIEIKKLRKWGKFKFLTFFLFRMNPYLCWIFRTARKLNYCQNRMALWVGKEWMQLPFRMPFYCSSSQYNSFYRIFWWGIRMVLAPFQQPTTSFINRINLKILLQPLIWNQLR